MARKMDVEGGDFTRGWFRKRNLSTFRELVRPVWTGRPVTYLEIGVFEGMSMRWVLQQILTSTESRAVGIDPWLMTRKLSGHEMEMVWSRALDNTREWGDRCQLIRSNSHEVLRRMNSRSGFNGIGRNSVDFCMIDGDHNAYAALDDAQQCLELVKPGGWLLFDDVENDKPKENHVKKGLEMFRTCVGNRVKEVWRHKYMVCLEVL